MTRQRAARGQAERRGLGERVARDRLQHDRGRARARSPRSPRPTARGSRMSSTSASLSDAPRVEERAPDVAERNVALALRARRRAPASSASSTPAAANAAARRVIARDARGSTRGSAFSAAVSRSANSIVERGPPNSHVVPPSVRTRLAFTTGSRLYAVWRVMPETCLANCGG